MRRPVGVIVAGILLLLSGLCGLLLIAVQIATMLITHSANAAMVPHGELVLLIFDGFIFAISVLSAWTGIALFRMRTWARYVTLVLAALGACFTGLAMMVCLLLLNTAPPVPNLAPATEHQVFLIAALVYGVMMLIAVFWIVYFNLASVRQAFAQGPPPPGTAKMPMAMCCFRASTNMPRSASRRSSCGSPACSSFSAASRWSFSPGGSFLGLCWDG